MSSWNIIGWVLIILVVLWVALNLLILLTERVAKWQRYMRTRNTKLEEGQIWRDRYGKTIYVGHRYATHVVLHSCDPAFVNSCSNIQWGESYDEWHANVRASQRYLSGSYRVRG